MPDPRLGSPSCTFLAAVVDGTQVELATLGDCRSMWLPAVGEPETLTEDDSWAAEVIAAGTKTAEEAYADRRAHVITRWLGADADPSWEARLSSFTAPGPGRLLLCSDGLWNYAETAADVAAAAAGDPDDLLATARRLTDFANAAGGSDNITVVLVDLPRLPAADHRKDPPHELLRVRVPERVPARRGHRGQRGGHRHRRGRRRRARPAPARRRRSC